VANGGFQFPCAAMHSAPELPLRQSGKPLLHQVGPRGSRTREMQAGARAFGELTLDERGFVSAVVIQNQMQVQLRRDSVVQPPCSLHP
jgi:hypothetical protein